MFYVEREVMYAYVDIDVFRNDVYITQLLIIIIIVMTEGLCKFPFFSLSFKKQE